MRSRAEDQAENGAGENRAVSEKVRILAQTSLASHRWAQLLGEIDGEQTSGWWFRRARTVPRRAGRFRQRKAPAHLPTRFGDHRKIGVNENCPCGSGKKFKRCCLGR
jgi:uncharacterized protein YecA (UPF0149 family)